MNQRRRLIKLGLAWGAAHLVLTVVLLIFSLDFSRLDTGQPEPLSEAMAGTAVDFLMLPLRFFWTPWMSRNVPNVIENLLFLLNSALWGFCIAGFRMWIQPRQAPSN